MCSTNASKYLVFDKITHKSWCMQRLYKLLVVPIVWLIISSISSPLWLKDIYVVISSSSLARSLYLGAFAAIYDDLWFASSSGSSNVLTDKSYSDCQCMASILEGLCPSISTRDRRSTASILLPWTPGQREQQMSPG